MAHGHQDFAQTAGSVTTYQLSDLAELAARLGSHVTYDRRGEVVFIDDFAEGMLRWSGSFAGVGGRVGPSFAASRHGGASAELRVGPVAGNTAIMEHLFQTPVSSNIGIEVSFARPTTLQRLTVVLTIFDLAITSTFKLRYDDVARQLQYLKADGSFGVLAASLFLAGERTLFHTLKFVVDTQASQYVRALLDQNVYPFPTVAAQTGGAGGQTFGDLAIFLTGSGAVGETVYIDDVIVTQNEPP